MTSLVTALLTERQPVGTADVHSRPLADQPSVRRDVVHAPLARGSVSSPGELGAWRLVFRDDRVECCAQGGEFLRFERLFDAPKQRSFLVAHVVSQCLAKSVECRNIYAPGLEVGDPASDVHVLDEDAHDIGIVGADVTREGGQEQLLFEAEVLPTLSAPEVECRLSDALRIGPGGALQP